MNDKNHSNNDAPTTGHVWDEDLQEFDNPLPRWWLWAFYGTIIFAFIYWLLFPTWPSADGWNKGIKKVEVDGKKEDWSTRSLLVHDLEYSTIAKNRKASLDKFENIPLDGLDDALKNPELVSFANKVGKVLFADNCATCHQQGGEGIIGLYPNLIDDDWLWGGSTKNVYTTIFNGHVGNMTPMKGILTDKEITDTAKYVLSLSGNIDVASNDEAIKNGESLFNSKGTCFVCHGKEAKGNIGLGAPNLNSQVWTIVDIPSTKTDEERINLVKHQIENGVVPGQRVMPAWKDRLTDAEIKALTIYVLQLGNATSTP